MEDTESAEYTEEMVEELYYILQVKVHVIRSYLPTADFLIVLLNETSVKCTELGLLPSNIALDRHYKKRKKGFKVPCRGWPLCRPWLPDIMQMKRPGSKIPSLSLCTSMADHEACEIIVPEENLAHTHQL